MSATLTAPMTVTELANLLGSEAHPLRELDIPPMTLSKAWAGGFIEFGHAKYCVTGRPGVSTSKPTLLIEMGMEWTGPKRGTHKGYEELKKDDALPAKIEFYQKYVKGLDPASGEEILIPARIEEAEAAKLLAFQVRLTDKGLGLVAETE